MKKKIKKEHAISQCACAEIDKMAASWYGSLLCRTTVLLLTLLLCCSEVHSKKNKLPKLEIITEVGTVFKIVMCDGVYY